LAFIPEVTFLQHPAILLKGGQGFLPFFLFWREGKGLQWRPGVQYSVLV
jgi:hypothetical protein